MFDILYRERKNLKNQELIIFEKFVPLNIRKFGYKLFYKKLYYSRFFSKKKNIFRNV